MKNKAFIICCLCSLFIAQAKAQELLNYPLDTVNGEEMYRYQVEKGIGLYRIGVNFDVSQSEIVRCNPQLRERGLHYGETLLIPTGRPVEKKTVAVRENKPVVPEKIQPVINERVPFVKEMQSERLATAAVAKADIAPAADTTSVDTTGVDSTADSIRVIELALMLPFESRQTKRSGNAERMMEFYQGALLALRDLQNDSTLYRLRVYDTERSERKVNELCDSTELDSVKGIIGLVYPIQIERMANWCEVHQVPLLLPFSDDIDLAHRSQVMQFNSSDTQEADSLCAWIQQQDDIHCVVVEVRESDIASSIRTLRKQMSRHEIGYTGMALRDLMNDSVAYALDSEKENLIILHSDRYQNVRMLLPHLQQLKEAGYRIRIVSQYSWQKEKIELPQVFTSMFTVEGEHEIYDATWSESYKTRHVSDLPRYDLLGYDLTKAMLAWLDGEKEIIGLQSAIRWTQINQGGFQNACVQVVAY